MTAIELRLSLLQEVATILDDEKMVKKALTSLRRLREKAKVKAEATAEEEREPTKEEILSGIREGLQDLKDLREGKDVGHKFMDAREWLKTLD